MTPQVSTHFIAYPQVLRKLLDEVLIPLTADLAPPNRRATFMSIVFSGVLMGVLLARVLSGIIAQLSSYRNIYWMGAAGEVHSHWLSSIFSDYSRFVQDNIC